MTSFRRWVRWISAAVAISAVSMIGLAIWFSDPPLIANVRDAAEFNSRLQAHFPLGTPWTIVRDELKWQGFESREWDSTPNKLHIAGLHKGDIACAKNFRIFWQSDPDGNLTKIGGRFGTVCL